MCGSGRREPDAGFGRVNRLNTSGWPATAVWITLGTRNYRRSRGRTRWRGKRFHLISPRRLAGREPCPALRSGAGRDAGETRARVFTVRWTPCRGRHKSAGPLGPGHHIRTTDGRVSTLPTQQHTDVDTRTQTRKHT